MRVLFLSRWMPYPPDNGAKIRIYQVLKALAARHSVDLISYHEDDVQPGALEALKKLCASVTLVRYRPFKPGRLRALLALFSPLPRSVVDTYNLELRQAVERAVAGTSYDMVIASEIDMAEYARRLGGVKKVLEELEVTKIRSAWQSETHPLRKLRAGLTWWKLQRYTAGLLADFDGVTVVSELERQAVAGQLPEKVFVSPNGVDAAHYPPRTGDGLPGLLIYTGAVSYRVNYEAVEFFLRDILPLVVARHPEARLLVTGRADAAAAQALGALGAQFSGYLPDVRSALADAQINVIPLLTGGGTRLKLLEALAAGLPVVSTSAGAEGVDLRPGVDFLLADTPEAFAAALIRLLDEPELRRTLAENGRERARQRYDWQPILHALMDYLDEITADRPASAPAVKYGLDR